MNLNVDVKFIQPFVDGALETLKVQCGTQAKPGAPYLKSANPPGYMVEIAGMIGVASDAFTGSLSLCFPKDTFIKVMERMLGEAVPDITPEIEDGAGELINIIFGFAKRQLNDRGYTIEKALPSIVRGAQISTRYLTSTPVVVMPFQTDIGLFHIEVAVQNGEPSKVA